jgi:hypothetical protein
VCNLGIWYLTMGLTWAYGIFRYVYNLGIWYLPMGLTLAYGIFRYVYNLGNLGIWYLPMGSTLAYGIFRYVCNLGIWYLTMGLTWAYGIFRYVCKLGISERAVRLDAICCIICVGLFWISCLNLDLFMQMQIIHILRFQTRHPIQLTVRCI